MYTKLSDITFWFWLIAISGCLGASEISSGPEDTPNSYYHFNEEVEMSSEEDRAKRFLMLRWIARIWSLPAVFIAVNELLFPDGYSIIEETWLAIATVVLMVLSAIGLLVAWWNERVGGWVSISLLVVFFITYWLDAAEVFPGWSMMLIFVALPAVLFLVFDYFNQKYYLV